MSPLTWGICDRKMVSAGFQQGKLNEKEASRFLLVREKKTLRGKLSKKGKEYKEPPSAFRRSTRSVSRKQKKKLTSSNIEREGNAKSNTNLT